MGLAFNYFHAGARRSNFWSNYQSEKANVYQALATNSGVE
jgi:hypothetical protein